MLDFARWTWTLALAALILTLAITRRFRSFPLFSLYLLATATQAAMHWRNMDFEGTWWINWAVAMSLFRLAAIAEIFWLRAAGMRRRVLWFVALCGISGGATFLAGRIRPDRPWIETAMVFRHIETGLLVALLLGIWVTYLWGSVVANSATTRFLRLHSWLMVLLIATRVAGLVAYEHLPIGPQFHNGELVSLGIANLDWARVQFGTYAGASACYAVWVAALWPTRSAPHGIERSGLPPLQLR